MPTSSALSLPPSTQGPRGSAGRTDAALARARDVAPGIEWEELRRVCKAAITAGILPRSIQREEQALAIALKSRELGIPPMQGFSQIHLIQGVASCSAQLMLALAYKHLPEFDMDVKESTGQKATIAFRRDSRRTPVTLTYTIEQARAAGLTSKDNWKNHPDDMLRNRVVSKGLRMVAPDVFAGLYLPDEVEEGIPTSEVEPIEVPRSGRPVVAPVEPAAVDAQFAPAEKPPEPASDEQKKAVGVAFRALVEVVMKAKINPTASTPNAATIAYARSQGLDLPPILSSLERGSATAEDARRTVESLSALAQLALAPKDAKPAETTPPMSAEDAARFDEALPF